MNKIETTKTLKFRLEEYLNMITKKKGSQYICTLCGSGTGKNKTPAGYLNDDFTFHCFSCGFHGDIFNLVGKVEGITDKAEMFRKTNEIFNLQAGRTKKINTVHKYTVRTDKHPAIKFPAVD